MEKEERDILIRVEQIVKDHIGSCKEKHKIIDKHMEDSPEVRDQVRDNTNFRKNATWAIRVISGAVASMFIKMWFFK